MEVPLWYKVAQSQLGFKEFLDRYNDVLFQEKDTLPVFVLSCLKHDDPYVAGKHVLSHLINGEIVSERALRYFYLYWVFVGKYGNCNLNDDIRPAIGVPAMI